MTATENTPSIAEKNPKSMVNPSNINKTCNRCHSDKDIVKEHALGTGPTPGELFERACMPRQGR